jgi:hypothetical protein
MVPLSTLQKSPYQEAHNAAPFWVLLGASDKPDLHKLWSMGIPVKLNAHSEGKPNGIPG